MKLLSDVAQQQFCEYDGLTTTGASS